MNARGKNANQAIPAVGINAKSSEAHFVIQDRACGIYFAGLGTWTAFAQRAFGFSSEREAGDFARKQGLQNVQIVRRV